MLLFQNGNSISIYLENKNPYVRLAVEDLRKDFLRVSNLTAAPKLVEEETSHCLIIKDNPYQGSDAIADEAFSIRCDGEKNHPFRQHLFGYDVGNLHLQRKDFRSAPLLSFQRFAHRKKECVGNTALYHRGRAQGRRV